MGEGEEYALRALRVDDALGSIKSGDAQFSPLSQFARRHAKKYEAANLSRTYVIHAVRTGALVAYITLVCSEVASEEPLPVGDGVEFPYRHYPAVKIARLLVDHRHRGGQAKGFGRYLVELALGIARTEICPAVGCRFVVVDSKTASVDFYKKCGFTLVDTVENRARDAPVMFLDLHKAGADVAA